jgi:endonuclease YncB( thermonuclease family)
MFYTGVLALTALMAGYQYVTHGGKVSAASEVNAKAAFATDTALFGGPLSRIIDGDGIQIRGGPEVRLGDFDAPELNQPGGREAKAALTRIAFGKIVECRRCEGARNPRKCTSHDRVIATCRLDGVRLGDLMRREGIEEGGR